MSTNEETARAAVFMCANEDYHGCTISVMGSEYRELESGVERHKRDIMGNDPRFDMTPEQKDVMGEYKSEVKRTLSDNDAENIFAPASKW